MWHARYSPYRSDTVEIRTWFLAQSICWPAPSCNTDSGTRAHRLAETIMFFYKHFFFIFSADHDQFASNVYIYDRCIKKSSSVIPVWMVQRIGHPWSKSYTCHRRLVWVTDFRRRHTRVSMVNISSRLWYLRTNDRISISFDIRFERVTVNYFI